MDLNQFKQTLKGNRPPAGIAPALAALWQDGAGQWDEAHELAQSDAGRDGAWVHAYLHRKEGDLANAAYWYARAGRETSRLSLEEEWEEIATALLEG